MNRNIAQIAIMFLVSFPLIAFCQVTSSNTDINVPPPDTNLNQPQKSTHTPVLYQKNEPAEKVVYVPLDPNIIRIAKEELRGDFYKESIECFRREIDSYKWAFSCFLSIASIIVAIAIYWLNKKVGKTEKKVEINDLWNKAGTAYTIGHYEEAAEIWKQIYKEFKPNNRQFFNNWGSSLLNWAGTIEKGDKQKSLANEAIEKYLEAEAFTKGIAAYNIACCYAILDDKDKCLKWLETAKQTGRLLSWEQARTDRDLKKYASDSDFKKILSQ